MVNIFNLHRLGESILNTHNNTRTIEEINAKIKKGDAQVLTAEQMKKLVENSGIDVAFKEVDVVTTGTFGAMCSSGAVINVGHSDPPIKMERVHMNDVPICHPGAAVDLFIGATSMSEAKPFEYGGGHLIEDLVKGKEVHLKATSYGTDCYPRTKLETDLSKEDLNHFQLLNFRNCYQHYNCAINCNEEILYTYMGKLLPRLRNATYSGSGELNPLNNDPNYETIGIGTRIFLGGSQGFVIGEGTQHEPKTLNGTLMVKGDAKKMHPEFLKGGVFTRYGTTLYVGVGIPIPILNKGLAKKTSIRDEEIFTNVVDYSVPRRDRPNLSKVNYKDLKSGSIYVAGKKVRVSSLSSLKTARKVADTLKSWIENADFFLTSPVERLPLATVFKEMKQTQATSFVVNVMQKAVTCKEFASVRDIAKHIVTHSVNHIVVVDTFEKIVGIVTSWDITRAMAEGKNTLSDIMTRHVIVTQPNEPLETASKKMAQHNISALPVINGERKVLGIVTSEDVSKLLGR